MANIEELYQRFLDRKCSREEAETLLDYFRNQPDSEHITAMIREQLEADSQEPSSPLDDLVVSRNRERLREAILGKPKAKVFRLGNWPAVAAALFILFSIASIIYWYNAIDTSQELTSGLSTDVEPGGNRAYITLSNGQRLALDSTRNAVSAIDGKLTYEDGSELSGTLTEYATINTPVGGEYRLILPDGTKAWLNAASSLRYPVRFTGKDRTVEIAGEVFLEVTTDKQKPFVVQTGIQRIQVLGTEFNVRNYSEKVITTLVRGRIALSEEGRGERVILAPGDQAALSGTGIQITQVNASDFTAWKDGIILIKDATLQETCAELERWYGVKFIFPAGFKNNELALNSINRTEMLSSVLAALKNSYRVDFEIKGKEVLVR